MRDVHVTYAARGAQTERISRGNCSTRTPICERLPTTPRNNTALSGPSECPTDDVSEISLAPGAARLAASLSQWASATDTNLSHCHSSSVMTIDNVVVGRLLSGGRWPVGQRLAELTFHDPFASPCGNWRRRKSSSFTCVLRILSDFTFT